MSNRRFVAVMRRPDGTYEQVSDYAESLAEAEETVLFLYSRAQKNPRDPWKLTGATVERITFDDYAHEMPAHDYVDWD